MRKWYLVAAMVVFLLSILSLAWADPVTREIYYQKKTTLTYPKTYAFRFSLWADETSTDPSAMVWSEEKSIQMTSGTIKTYLGSEAFPLSPADFGQQLWVQVERKTKSGYVVVGTRDIFGVVPYAMWSEMTGGGGGIAASDTVSDLDGTSTAGASTEYSRGDHQHGIGTGAITSTHILDSTITNADILPTAAIEYSKLSGVASSTHNHDATYVNEGEASSITSAMIADGQVGINDLANGSVTKAKLSAAGGSSGQVLGTDGSSLVWQTASGLTLPYADSISSASPGFSVANTAGAGVEGRNSTNNNVGQLGTNTAGGFFSGGTDHNDIILGGHTGRINTDPGDETSDLYLSSNNDIIVKLDNDGGEEGVFKILNSGGTNLLTVDESATTLIGSASKGLQMRTTGSAVDLESLGSALAINYGLGTAQNTYLNVYGGNVGIGTENPQQKLHVAGITRFDVGAGQVNVSSPGGWPGLIAYSANFHRRDIFFDNSGISMGAGTSSSPPEVSVRIYENGRLAAKALEITGGADLSEQFDVRKPSSDISLEPGMVVVIDPENPGALTMSGQAYDRRVAGIISGAGGVRPGMLMGQKGSVADGAQPVALTGRVYCWADTANGPIELGDLLTTSGTPGHAMKVSDYPRAQGAILGKAMSSLKSGKGLILVLVSLQ